MEPGVTVWGRAGSFLGTAQARIYRCRISTVVKIGALDSDGWSRRDASLVGASLSADVPLTYILEHMFFGVKGFTRRLLGDILTSCPEHSQK